MFVRAAADQLQVQLDPVAHAQDTALDERIDAQILRDHPQGLVAAPVADRRLAGNHPQFAQP